MNKIIKKIVWVCNDFVVPGGGERLLLEGVVFLNKVGINAKVIVFRFDEKVLFNGKYNKDNIIILKCYQPKTKFLHLNHFLRSLSESRALRKYFFKEKPDAILTQAYVWEALCIFFATMFSNFKYYVLIHGTMFQKPTDNLKYFFPYNRALKDIRNSAIGYVETVPIKLPKISFAKHFLYQIAAMATYIAIRKSRLIFVLSKSGKWEIKKLYNKDAIIAKGAFPKEIYKYSPRSTIIQNYKKEGKKVIVSICRLVTKKRIDLTIRGFALLRKRFKNTILIIGGTGPDEKRLIELVREEKIQDDVRFLGFVDDSILWDIMAAADVFVQPDIADFNITPYEALALGTKVIWTNEMDIDKYLKGNPFIFVINPTPYNMADAMKLAIKDNEKMPKNYLEKMKNYSWDKYFSSILEEIRKT